MPVDYKLGKVYKIYSAQAEECYVGSSAQKHLSTRFAQHKNSYKKWSADPENEKFVSVYDLLKFGDCVIEILEVSPCTCREELLKKEREWFDKLPCVNKLAPYRTVDEKISIKQETHRKYREEQGEKLLKKKRFYHQDNKDTINRKRREKHAENPEIHREADRKWSQNNKAKKAESDRNYREAHKDTIKRKHREYRARKKAEKEQKQKDENIVTNE